MTADALVTVVVAVKNAANTLDRCLASIEGQTDARWEALVMDGGSKDGTLERLRRWRADRIRWESHPDRGVYQAWNRALALAAGKWICFLGADDWFWDCRVLERMRPHLAAASRAGVRVVYGEALKIDSRGRVVRRSGRPWPRIRWQIRHGMPLIHAGIFHHRKLFRDRGPFDERYAIAGDYDLLLRELLERPARFAQGVRVVGHGAGGLSDRRNLATYMEIARARRRHGLAPVSPVWALVFARALMRAARRRAAGEAGKERTMNDDAALQEK